MRSGLAILLFLAPMTLFAEEGTRLVSLETAVNGLYAVADGKCDVEVANLKLEKEPCKLARRQGDDEHVYLVTADKRGELELIIEGTMSETSPNWKLIYRKGAQST